MLSSLVVSSSGESPGLLVSSPIPSTSSKTGPTFVERSHDPALLRFIFFIMDGLLIGDEGGLKAARE
jgi:hypothetical protein